LCKENQNEKQKELLITQMHNTANKEDDGRIEDKKTRKPSHEEDDLLILDVWVRRHMQSSRWAGTFLTLRAYFTLPGEIINSFAIAFL